MSRDVHISWPAHITKHLNFFRIHLTFFTIIPFIISGFFYAANGSASGNANSTELGTHKVTYIDSLFMCFSAMTVTGMVTVNISAVHLFQQFLLFFLFVIGDPSFVSLIMVLVRKRFFRQHCFQLVQNDHFKRTNTILPPPSGVFSKTFTWHPTGQGEKAKAGGGVRKRFGKGAISVPMQPRAYDNFVEDQEAGTGNGVKRVVESAVQESPVDMVSPTSDGVELSPRQRQQGSFAFTPDESTAANTAETSRNSQNEDGEDGVGGVTGGSFVVPRAKAQIKHIPLAPIKTIQIAEPPRDYQNRQLLRARTRAMSMGQSLPTREETMSLIPPAPTSLHRPHNPTDSNYLGGFPSVLGLLPNLVPNSTRDSLNRRFSKPMRRMTVVVGQKGLPHPHLHSSHPAESGAEDEGWASNMKAQVAKWLPQNESIVIGRNSRFYTEELTDELLEEIGGIEYRALRFLSYFVTAYIFLFQAVPFAIIAIYLSKVDFFNSAFDAAPGVQTATVNKAWFSLFLVSSGYSGTGMSLLDQGMIPLVSCYLVIYILDMVLLVGNHALPMTLRFLIWSGTKIWRKGQTHETLHFLLDHPRRCYLYLFPSHQTWYLVILLLGFVAIEMLGFFLLNIGLPLLRQNGWQLFSDALLQSLSVRASGFGVLPVATFAPALLFLYVILMYVAIYPIAMSVRSTNVYEERALGVYEKEEESSEEPNLTGHRREVFSKYILWHMRRQLAFDIWPLGLAILFITIFERGKILNPDTSSWFTVFRIIFECTSAYSTIGLSMGTPNNNFSFCGEFSTASKLVMILVMLRGRHRGLPVAIDRAILLPHEYSRIRNPNEELGRKMTMQATIPKQA